MSLPPSTSASILPGTLNGAHVSAVVERDAPPSPGAIRLVALDIDGTILTPEGHVTPRLRAAIKATIDRGIPVVLCTGRAFSKGVSDVGAELGLSLPAIVRNGTAVQELGTGRLLEQHALPPSAVAVALDLLLERGLSPIVEEGPQHGDGLYTLPLADCHASVFYYGELWQRSMHLRHVEHARDLYAVRDANWIGGCGTRSATRDAFEALKALTDVKAAWYGEWQADDALHCTGLTAAGCSKASALARFATNHGVSLANVLAVGDYLNDMEMLAEVGWGVAMGQAPDVLKQVAKAIVPDNTQDGAAVALERYVLSEAG